MIAPYIRKTLEAVHSALKRAGLTVSDLEEVLLAAARPARPSSSAAWKRTCACSRTARWTRPVRTTGAAIQAAVMRVVWSRACCGCDPLHLWHQRHRRAQRATYPYTSIPLIRTSTPHPGDQSEGFETFDDGQRSIIVHVY